MSPPRPVLLALLVAAPLLGLAACSSPASSEDAFRDAEPGDCLGAPEDIDDEFEIVDCGPDSDYEVLATPAEETPADPDGQGPSPCDEEEAYDYSFSLTEGDPLTICLQQTPREGDCVYQGRYIECDDGGGNVVEAVLTGTTDPAGCPTPGGSSRVYEEDETVVCLGANAP